MDEICQDDQWFEQAFTYMNKHDITLPNDKKLHFYGLFKQATVGDCDKPKPKLYEFVERAKWDSWQGFKGLSFRDARNEYIAAVEGLNVGWSRRGEYEHIPSAANIKDENGMGAAVSSMAYGEEEESDDIFGYARNNDLEKIKHVADNDPSLLNMKNDEGLNVLHIAADRGYKDIVLYLIKTGADINILSDDKETALHYACISEQLEIAQLLIQNGCDTSLVDAEGMTAFEQADLSFVDQLNSI